MPEDPYSSYVVLDLPFSGTDGETTFIDVSPKNISLSAAGPSGAAQIDTDVKKIGPASAYFDGTGGYIQAGPSTDIVVASQFTIECWVKVENETDDRDEVIFLFGNPNSGGVSSTQYPNVRLESVFEEDAYESYVSSRMRFNGTDGATTFTDDKSSTWGDHNLVEISTITKSAPASISSLRTTSTTSSWLKQLTGGQLIPEDSSFVIEAAIYIKSGQTLSAHGAIFSQSGSGAGSEQYFGVDANRYLKFVQNGQTILISPDPIPFDTWTDVALKSSEFGVTSLFVNGVNVAEVETFYSWIEFASTQYIAHVETAGTQGSFYGFIDEFVITRYAKYSSNYFVELPRPPRYVKKATAYLGGLSYVHPISVRQDVWTHIALERRALNKVVLYVAGSGGTPFTKSTSFSGQYGTIGFPDLTWIKSFTGHIDAFRFTNGVARYGADFTPSEEEPIPTLTLEASIGISSAITLEQPLCGRLQTGLSFPADLTGTFTLIIKGALSGSITNIPSLTAHHIPIIYSNLVGNVSPTLEFFGASGFSCALSATLPVSASFEGEAAIVRFLDSSAFSSMLSGEHRLILLDNAVLALTQIESALLQQIVADGIVFGDLLVKIIQENLADGVITSDDVLGTIVRIALLEELLAFNITQEQLPFFRVSLLSALVLGDALGLLDQVEIDDVAAFSETLATIAQLLTTIQDQLIWSDALENHFTLWQSLADAASFNDTLDWQALWNQVLADTAVFSGTITLGGIEYFTWVLNPSNKAFSSYSNFYFNSFVQIGTTSYGIADDGVYLLEGEDDAGDDISSKARFGLMDFGSTFLKNVRHAYLGIVSGGEALRFRTVAIKEGRRVQDEYLLHPKQGSSTFELRGKFSNAVQARYWSFEIENVDGGSVEIDGIELGMILLPRKR